VELIEKLLRTLPDSAEAFRRQNPHDFLVRRPLTIFQEENEDGDDDIEYRTVTVSPDDDGIPAWEWWLAALVKRPGNPFPDHLSVGRATNCDIVMRFRYVSKLHARFHLEAGRVIALEDQGSSNGTAVNGRRVRKSQPIEIKTGDKLSFGSLTVTLMSADELYAFLRNRRNSSQAPPRSSVG
jgi:hypothetical protein